MKNIYKLSDIADWARKHDEMDFDDSVYLAWENIENVVFPKIVDELRKKYGGFFTECLDKFGQIKKVEFVYIDDGCVDEDSEDYVPYSDKLANCYRHAICVEDGTLSEMYSGYGQDAEDCLGWAEMADVDIHYGEIDKKSALYSTGVLYNIFTEETVM